ncbi:hypothetical protein LP414_14710 [Polaromonas sp. P1(28)-13]|nr:hypothetical protein LP414_14710 [Polaromonas sp. P1(28)-13]
MKTITALLRIWQKTTSGNAEFFDQRGMIEAVEKKAGIGRVTGYTKDIELKMLRLFATLSEKDRRRYAAIEALKLNHGGIEYVCGLFKMDAKTVRRGLTELELAEDPAASRVRKRGRTQMPDAEQCDASGELPQNSGGVYGGRPDARRGFVDQLVQA